MVTNILVACNPFEVLDIYGTTQSLDATRAAEADSGSSNNDIKFPHVYTIGAIAYRQMQMNLTSQAILISGESGAGKTETTKRLLSFLANVSSRRVSEMNEISVEDKILQSNPLLEALGNAKTLRNDNSSR